MSGIRVNLWLRALIVMFFAGGIFEFVTPEADARAGRARSMGRSSGYNSRPAPAAQPQAAPNQFGNPASAPSPAMNGTGGGFLRGMAGGIAGGFLGSMLFSSIGRAAGGLGGGTGGGIGFFEIALFAGLAYLGFRWWKSRQQPATGIGMHAQGYSTPQFGVNSSGRISNPEVGQFSALAPAGIDTETASDIFFKVQGAWTRRDDSSISNLLGKEMQTMLASDLAELKQEQKINRLENISVRKTEVTDSWLEEGQEFSKVRFTANLLDYTVSEKTGQVVEGSDSLPVKFEEDWTFTKGPNTYDTWRLAGIHQV